MISKTSTPIMLLSTLALAALLSAPVMADAADVALAVGPQYDTAHVYVDVADIDRFVTSFTAAFGGASTKQVVATVTPVPSSTTSQLIQTPEGTVSLFGFKTPIPYPFGTERTGYLVKNMDVAIRAARSAGAAVVVDSFPDPIGRDAIIQWPGGVNMQLYWHTSAPNYPALETVPENRVYVSKDAANTFIHDFVAFSHGKIIKDTKNASGAEIGRDAANVYRHVQIKSGFGRLAVFVTDGHLPFPFGHETSGYEVKDLNASLSRATASGAKVLVPQFSAQGRTAAMVEFPGGYVAEIHATAAK